MQEKFGAAQNESVYAGVSDHLWAVATSGEAGAAAGQR